MEYGTKAIRCKKCGYPLHKEWQCGTSMKWVCLRCKRKESNAHIKISISLDNIWNNSDNLLSRGI